ncbi:MAG: hypothetical protein IJ679_08240, partial [Lachnospiraceae bacterium]|nr:hypothetical protein [Lachnospiraceae bacterium]
GVVFYNYTKYDAKTKTKSDPADEGRAYPMYETVDGEIAYLVLDDQGNTQVDADGNLLFKKENGEDVNYKAIQGYLTDKNGVMRYAKCDDVSTTPQLWDELSAEKEFYYEIKPEKYETVTAYAYNDEGMARRYNSTTNKWEISRSYNSHTGAWELDKDTCYTISSLKVNDKIVVDPSLIAHMHQNGDIAYDLGEAIYTLWNSSDCTLHPADTAFCSFSGFYTKIVGELATTESVYETMKESLSNTKQSIENNRQSVIGVSTDEELQTMIKFQNAYNASSRYINVVNSMIETLILSMGA